MAQRTRGAVWVVGLNKVSSARSSAGVFRGGQQTEKSRRDTDLRHTDQVLCPALCLPLRLPQFPVDLCCQDSRVRVISDG